MEPISSAIIGLVGGGLTSFFKYKDRQLQLKQVQQKYSYQLQMIQAKTEAALAKVSGEIQIEETIPFKDSLKVQTKEVFKESYMDRLYSGGTASRIVRAFLSFAFGCVDVARYSVRWIVTFFCLAMSATLMYGTWEAMKRAGIDIPGVATIAMWQRHVDDVLNLTTTILFWYFGARAVQGTKRK